MLWVDPRQLLPRLNGGTFHVRMSCRLNLVWHPDDDAELLRPAAVRPGGTVKVLNLKDSRHIRTYSEGAVLENVRVELERGNFYVLRVGGWVGYRMHCSYIR